uniref:Uncharacterized protein n=1 Tax=Theileria annulata TaxID=5874 RepID=A0A3B0NIP5_THEAN
MGKFLDHLEEMVKNIVIPDDYTRFAMNFEITFTKSCKKIITNTCNILINMVCQEVQRSKHVQDQHTTAFNEYYLNFSQGSLDQRKTKSKVKTIKKGAGTWIFSGLEKLEKLENIHRIIVAMIEMLVKLNKKFKELPQDKTNSLLFSTLNHSQNLIINTLCYCFMLLVYSCPHVLSVSTMSRVLNIEDLIEISRSQKIIKNKPNHVMFMSKTLWKLITANPGKDDVYQYLETKGIFHHSSISSEYNKYSATLDLRILKDLFYLLNLKLYLKPLEITNKLSEIFVDACNRLLYMMPEDPSLLTKSQDITLPSGRTVKISDEWALNQRITTSQKATSAFNEAINKPV